MISTKLTKNASANHLMIQFSASLLGAVFQKFYNNCKDQGVLVRRSEALMQRELNFHLVDLEEKKQLGGVILKNVPCNLNFVMTVLYVTSEQEDQGLTKIAPIQRSLLLRQSLDTKFYLNYEFENTQSERQSLIFLCELSAAIINSKFDKGISFYDQSTSEIKGKSQKESQKLWLNILYQIPGLGQEKCLSIAQKYPNYSILLEDYKGRQQLKDLLVKRGLKEARLGQAVASRVYKSLFGDNSKDNIMDRGR